MESVLFRRSLVIGILILFVGASILPSIGGSYKETDNETNIKEKSSIPLFFTKNKGQFPEEVLFQIQTSSATVYLCKDEIVTVFKRQGVDESEVEILSTVTKLVDANESVIAQGEGILPHHNNYFIGNNPDKWYTEVPNYKAVYYNNIYPGIDLKFYSAINSLKYDFIVSPGADPSIIQIQYKGIENLFLTPTGDIQIDTNFGSIYEKKPFIFQEINGIKKEIIGQYKIIEPEIFGFTIDENYNSEFPLVIDPTLVYSTYLGGTDYDIGREIDVDSSGDAYIVGETASNDFPTQNPHQGTYMGLTDAFVTKLAPPGNSLIFSTYFGGTSHDYGSGIDVDSSGIAYITGTTYSSDFPTANPLYPNLHGIQDAFVAKFSSTGTLMYSTYLGGSGWEWGIDIAVENNGVSYTIGFTDSSDFPVFNAYDGSWNGNFDFFISKIDPPGGFLMFSTYLGGSNADIGNGIDIDNNGNAFVTGYTWSSNFPVTANAYDGSYNGGADICIATLDTITGGSGSLVYGSYIFGQGDDFGYDIAVDNNNIMYVTGETGSTINQFFPVTSNAYQQFLNGARDAFFFKLDSSLTPANQMLYCSYLGGMTGGSGSDSGRSIDLDSNNNAYIAGVTECSDFPLVNSLHTYKGNNEAFASLFDPTAVGAASLLDSTYIGGTNADEGYGIAVDNNDDTYVTGLTYSTDFPIQNPYQAANNGLGDAFVTKFSPTGVNNPPNKPTKPSGPTNGKPGTSYPYQTDAIDPEGHLVRYGWDWIGDGLVDQWDDNSGAYYTSGVTITTTHSWAAQGTYQVRVMAEDIHGAGSVWSDPLTVTMPRNKAVQNTLFLRLLENLVNNMPFLKYILGL